MLGRPHNSDVLLQFRNRKWSRHLRCPQSCTIRPDSSVSMPCSYVIDSQKRLVLSTAWDRITFNEVIAHQDQLSSDSAFNPDFDQLVDATAVTAVDATLDEIKRVASRHIFSSSSHRAFVASKPEVFGVGRLLGAHMGMGRTPQQVHIFYDLPSALKWLGLDHDPRVGE